MTPAIFASVIAGVLLSAIAQVVLRIAMTRPAIQAAIADAAGEPLALAIVMLRLPELYAGIVLYALSMAVWLYVLSKIEVSLAYPFVGLGIVVTTLAGYFMLGEQVGPMRLAGCVVVAIGLVMVARS